MTIRWTHIVLHHTGAEEKNAEQIRNYHKSKGWGDIGYNFVIETSGKLVKGRSLGIPGAHTSAADMNYKAIGIALIGNFELRAPTEDQINTLISLLRELMEEHQIPQENILSHKKVPSAKTLCPGKNFPFNQVLEALPLKQNFWRVQLGAFTNEKNARSYAQYLKTKGLDVYIVYR